MAVAMAAVRPGPEVLDNLNPDFYKTTVKDPVTGRYVQLIYSTLDNLAICAADDPVEGALPIAPDKDLVIYAWALTVHGTVAVPGGNIHITARTLNAPDLAKLDISIPPPVAADDVTRPTPASGGTVAVAGPVSAYPTTLPMPPAPAGAPGAQGASGAPGTDNQGVLRLMFDTSDGPVGQGGFAQVVLDLLARGGDGNPGRGGQNGSAGAKGRDGRVQKYVGADKAWVATSDGRAQVVPLGSFSADFRQLWQDEGWAEIGGHGGRGGDGGRGGAGGAGGELQYFLPSRIDGMGLDNRGGEHGADGEPGAGGLPGDGGVQTVVETWPSGERGPSFTWDPISQDFGKETTVKLGGGTKGDDGSRQDRRPVGNNEDPWRGAYGESEHGDVTPAMLGAEFDSTFLVKLLARAENLFLMAGPLGPHDDPTRTPAYRMLDWMIGILEPQPAGDDPESQRKQVLLVQARVLRRRCADGRNLFGRAPDWVPRRSIDEYAKDMQALVGPLKDLEGRFTTLMKETDGIAKIDAHLSDALQDMDLAQQSLSARIDRLTQRLRAGVDEIDTLTADVGAVRVGLQNVLSVYRLDIATYRQGCSVANLFKSLEMVAFEPTNLAMVTVQGLELADSASGLADGVNRDDVIRRLEHLQIEAGGSLAGALAEKFQALVQTGPDGGMTYKDDRTPLLLANVDAFEQEMKNFVAAFPDHGDALAAVTWNLKDTIRRRGETLLEYNALLGQAVQLSAQKTALAERQATIAGKLYDHADPTRTGCVSHVATIYQDLRAQATELVYMADRALAYWSGGMARAERGFASFQARAQWADGPSPSQFGAADLLAAVADMSAQMRAQQERFAGPEMRLPSDPRFESEIVLSITDKAALAALAAQHRLDFSTSLTPPRSLHGKLDLRVWYVRPRLRGIKAPPGAAVEIDIVQLGSDAVQPQVGPLITFTHDAVASQFSYRPDTPAGQQDYGGGGDGRFYQGRDDGYAPLGLLARWALRIDPDANPGLALGGLTAVDIEFGCLAHVAAHGADAAA